MMSIKLLKKLTNGPPLQKARKWTGGVLQSPHNSISRSGDWVPPVQTEPIGNMALLAARTYDPGSLYY